MAIVDTCLKAAEKTGGFGCACVGLVADPCIKAAEGVNDDVARWKTCSSRELAIWTQKTNEALKEIPVAGGRGRQGLAKIVCRLA